MPSRLFPFFRPLLAFGAILLAVSLGGLTRGQDELPGNTQEGMEEEMKKKGSLLAKLLGGTTAFDANNKEHVEAFDIGARFDTYRYTWVSIKVDDVYTDFEKRVMSIQRNKSAQQPEVASAYTKAVTARAREVINLRRKPNNLARLNATRVLAKLADLGQGDLTDALLEVFTQEIARDADPKGPQRNDGVVYYSLRGLRELLTLPPPAPDKPAVVSAERDKKVAEALLAFIAKKPAFTKDTTTEEKDGYCALRREAVHALAYCRTPALPSKGITLLRIMARDGYTPPPHIDETVEAAIGVARLRSEIDGKDYQPDYAAFQLAQFVEYFTKYYLRNRDMGDRVEHRPYRIFASRLLEALEAMKAETKSEYASRAIDECRKVLTPVEKGELVKTLDLETWLSNNPPPKDGLFQGVANSAAKPANRP